MEDDEAEKIDYYTQMRRIGRTEPIHRTELLFLKSRDDGPILPLESDDVEAFKKSPLYAVCPPGADASEMASTLMGPGPWTFQQDLKLPGSCSELRFTNKNKRSNIMVTHMLKVLMRVERGDEKEVDPKTGKKRLFDIIVQIPVQILSVSTSSSERNLTLALLTPFLFPFLSSLSRAQCRCNPEWTSLPGYTDSFQEALNTSPSCPCPRPARRNTGASIIPPPPPPSSSSSTLHAPFSLSHTISRTSIDTTSGADTASLRPSRNLVDTLLHRNELFEQLVSGQMSEIGEPPPPYVSFTASAQAMVVQ
jgi:hypothetical protein